MKKVACLFAGLVLTLPLVSFAQTSNNASVLANLYAQVEQLALQIEAIQAEIATPATTNRVPTCSIAVDPNLTDSQSNTSGQLTTLGIIVSWKSTNATSGSITGGDENTGSSWTANANSVVDGSVNEIVPVLVEHSYEFTGTFSNASSTTTCDTTLFLVD